jgi:hypothetical protein
MKKLLMKILEKISFKNYWEKIDEEVKEYELRHILDKEEL